VAQLLCPVVVGRDAELAGLVERVGAPRGGAVVLLGEAGVGKSRLLRELAARTRDRGALVVGGRAVQAAHPTPYRPVAEALVAACRRGGPPQAPELAPYRAALGRLLPEWHRPDVRVVESTVVLGEGLLRVFDVLGAGRPVLVLLDDLHWADPDTLAVLEYLADHSGEQRLHLVATSRSGVVPRVLHDLVARRAAALLELVPLSPPEVAEMARCCLGGVVPTGLDGLLARAGGVPFLVEELLAAAAETDALVRDGGGWRAGPGDPHMVPRTYADAVAARVAALDPVDRDVPAAAALLGSRVDAALLGAVVGRAPGEVLRVLERCTAAQLVTRDPGGYGFRHALARDAVLATLPGPAIRDLAARARAAVEVAHPGLPDPWDSLAVELALRVGDTDDAAGLLLAAARRAVASGALPTAAAALDRAQELLPADAARALDVVELRVEVAALAGDADTAFALGTVLVERLDALPQASGRRARIHLRLAEAAVAATRWPAAQEQLDAARALALAPADVPRAEATAAHVLLDTGRLGEAEHVARRALAQAERLDLGEPACRALEVLGRITRDRDTDEAEAVFTKQLRTARAHGLTVWAMRATHELGGLDLRRHSDATRLRAARDLAVETGALATVATLDLQLSVVAWLALDPQECLAAARRCADVARRWGLELLLAEALTSEMSAHAMTGRRAAMERVEADIGALGRPEPELQAAVRSRWGMYALLRDDRVRAVAEFDATVALARTGSQVYVRTYWQTWALLRTVDGAGGDEARAEVRAVTAAGGFGDALLHYADAVAAGRAGHADDAEASFAAARAAVASPGNRAQRHLAERIVAECALADGWGNPIAWLTEAAPFFREVGQEHLERACRSLLRRAGAPVPRRQHGHRAVRPELAALGVTDREADVFALVVAGLTSREIAARLYISVRTVDKHVERLLAKTGAAHRGELRHRGWVRSASPADT
jgi:DNA-binding CsgD family transcriptional regulator